MTNPDIEAIVKGLSEAQREWLLSLEPTLDEQPRAYDTVFDVGPFIDLSPEEYCPETGCLLVPAERIWLGSNGCQVGVRAWSRLNEAGLAVHRTLTEGSEG